MSIIKKAKMTIGVMWQDVVSTQFMNSLGPMLIYSQSQICEKHEYIHYIWASASYHELARGELVDNALGESLLSLDTDHQFAPDLLTRLLHFKKREKARVISGVYTYKNPPYAPVANVWGEDGKRIIPLGAWHPDAEVLKVGPVGAGCLLVDTDVFTEIKNKLREPPFMIRPGLSEDYSFAARCKQLDIPIHLCVNVEAHHLAPRNVLHIADYVSQFAPAFSAQQQANLKNLQIGIDPEGGRPSPIGAQKPGIRKKGKK